MKKSYEASWGWADRIEAAQREVRTTLDALPLPLRNRATQIPVTCEPVPSRALVRDGIAPDTLGLFSGGSFTEEGCDLLPAQITLFLDNLWDESGQDPREYGRQVRQTLLHELGHYLGLDEDDLQARELD